MNPELPEKLTEYWQYVQPLGKGGQAVVHLLKAKDDNQAHRNVALKIFSGTNEHSAERLRREVRTLKEISHPNVAQVLGEDIAQQKPWYIMPVYKDFKTWWNKKKKTYSDEDLFDLSLEIIQSLSLGLSALHSKGYIHRDIKPSNIQITPKGERPVLCDFGLVLDPSKERLSEIDPIRKQSAQIIHRADKCYQHSEADDCFDLASVWSWMLAKRKGLPFEYYHWRHFTLLESSRIERMRAVWACCSDVNLCPKNATELLILMKKLFPDDKPSDDNSINFKPLVERAAQAQASAHLEAAQTQENIVALIESCAPKAKEFVSGLAQMGQSVSYHFSDVLSRLEWLSPQDIPSVFNSQLPKDPNGLLTTRTIPTQAFSLETDISKLKRTLILEVSLRPEWLDSARFVIFVSGAAEVLKPDGMHRDRVHQINWWLWMNPAGKIEAGVRPGETSADGLPPWQTPPPEVTDTVSLLTEIQSQIQNNILG